MSDKKINREKLVHLPQLVVNDRQLHDLELLALGGFAPLRGFLNELDYKSVVEDHRLSDGSLWPIPIVFDTHEEAVKKYDLVVGKEVVLADAYGTLLAILYIESVYSPDKEREALKVYGTNDMFHPGVKYLFQDTGSVYLGGRVEALVDSFHHDFLDLRKTPAELKKHFREKIVDGVPGVGYVIAFQTRNPIHRAHAELIRRAAQEHNAHILIHPTVGPTKEGDIEVKRRVKSYRALHAHHFPNVTLAVAPIAMRMAGPREALWHALIRKNYGATHFIVGRDHAGPGKDSHGRPFYEQYEAQEFTVRHSKEAGIQIVISSELVFVKEKKIFKRVDEIGEGETVLSISGTEFRQRLLEGKEIPSWFSFKEVVHALREEDTKKGTVILFTGLSGAGKSTIALRLKERLEQEKNIPITFLDGDLVRSHLSYGLGFSRDDRNRNIERIGFVAREVARHGGLVICSVIAPYKESRTRVRKDVEKYGNLIEVYVKTPLEVCQKRDVKGLYKKAELGLLKGMTGISDPYEEPQSPEVIIDTTKLSISEAVEKVLAQLYEKLSQ